MEIETIKIDDNYFQICVSVMATNRLNTKMSKQMFLSNMEQIKDWDELYPNYHRPAEYRFNWIIKIRKSTVRFKWFSVRKYVTLRQTNTHSGTSCIHFNNKHECYELLRLIENKTVMILNTDIGPMAIVSSVISSTHRVEELLNNKK